MFFFQQKTAYEMRISDWSSDVCFFRSSLGIKQLEKGAPAVGGGTAAAGSVKKNDVITVTVLEVRDNGLEVQAGDDGATGFIKRADLGRDRDEQRAERYQVGQKFDAMVIGFDRSKKPNFSVKAMQIAEEKRSEEHTSELQSLMRISYAVF